MVLGTGILGGVYFFLQSGFNGGSIKGLVMALAYAWGLILAIYLMGHGLVALPRRLIRNASVGERLKRIQSNAPNVHDKLEEAHEELSQVEAQVFQLRQRKTGLNMDMQDWIEELAETSTPPDARMNIPMRTPGAGIPSVITERFLADLARKLKRARHKKARFANEWKNLVQEASDLQAIMDSSASKKLDASPRHRTLSRLIPLSPTMRYHFYANILPFCRLALGSFLALASISLVWSEIIHPHAPKLSIVGMTVVHHPSSSRGQIGFGGQMIASAWLLYMCTAALFSVTEVKVWGNRALVKRQTYSESACWYSLQVAKLTVPIAYNFLTLMPPTVYKETSFYAFLGKLINLTPLGGGFDLYFPTLIILPICATGFNLYGKVKNVIGFGMLDDESDGNNTGFGTGGWREGRALIERDLQGDQTNLRLSSTTRDANIANAERNTGQGGRRSPLLPVAESRSSTANAASRTSDGQEEDTSSRYFFQDLGERVRNTLDTTNQPDWLRDIGDGFKRPKWMSNDGGNENGGSSLGRWFGGGSTDGRVRL